MISFLPKTNAVQDVYAAKTDLMVPVGVVGTTVEPTPEPTQSPIESVTLRCDEGIYWACPRVAEWFDEEYGDQLVAEQVVYAAYIKDANGNSLVSPPEVIGIASLYPRSYDEVQYEVVIDTDDSGQLPTETGTYELKIWTNGLPPSPYEEEENPADYVVTGEWTSVPC